MFGGFWLLRDSSNSPSCSLFCCNMGTMKKTHFCGPLCLKCQALMRSFSFCFSVFALLAYAEVLYIKCVMWSWVRTWDQSKSVTQSTKRLQSCQSHICNQCDKCGLTSKASHAVSQNPLLLTVHSLACNMVLHEIRITCLTMHYVEVVWNA